MHCRRIYYFDIFGSFDLPIWCFLLFYFSNSHSVVNWQLRVMCYLLSSCCLLKKFFCRLIYLSISEKMSACGYGTQTLRGKLMVLSCYKRLEIVKNIECNLTVTWAHMILLLWHYPILQALPSSGKEVIELLDILLRWFVLRFCESNTTCLLKVCKLKIYRNLCPFV
jgi:hypothetical protein